MLQRRARDAGIPTAVCNHTFRATGITAYLDNGGSLENAQAMAAHESPLLRSAILINLKVFVMAMHGGRMIVG